MNLCLDLRQRVARPNCALVFAAEDAFPWMEKLAYEWVIEACLPFLDQSEFKTSVISSFREDGNRSPNI